MGQHTVLSVVAGSLSHSASRERSEVLKGGGLGGCSGGATRIEVVERVEEVLGWRGLRIYGLAARVAETCIFGTKPEESNVRC